MYIIQFYTMINIVPNIELNADQIKKNIYIYIYTQYKTTCLKR